VHVELIAADSRTAICACRSTKVTILSVDQFYGMGAATAADMGVQHERKESSAQA